MGVVYLTGQFSIADTMMVYRFDGDENWLSGLGDGLWNVEIRDPNTGEIGSLRQEFCRVNWGWQIAIYPDGDESYQSMRKRLLLTWERVLRLTEADLKQARDEANKGYEGDEDYQTRIPTPVIPYLEPEDVDEGLDD